MSTPLAVAVMTAPHGQQTAMSTVAGHLDPRHPVFAAFVLFGHLLRLEAIQRVDVPADFGIGEQKVGIDEVCHWSILLPQKPEGLCGFGQHRPPMSIGEPTEPGIRHDVFHDIQIQPLAGKVSGKRLVEQANGLFCQHLRRGVPAGRDELAGLCVGRRGTQKVRQPGGQSGITQLTGTRIAVQKIGRQQGRAESRCMPESIDPVAFASVATRLT